MICFPHFCRRSEALRCFAAEAFDQHGIFLIQYQPEMCPMSHTGSFHVVLYAGLRVCPGQCIASVYNDFRIYRMLYGGKIPQIPRIIAFVYVLQSRDMRHYLRIRLHISQNIRQLCSLRIWQKDASSAA
jgi:hypothetical protein